MEIQKIHKIVLLVICLGGPSRLGAASFDFTAGIKTHGGVSFSYGPWIKSHDVMAPFSGGALIFADFGIVPALALEFQAGWQTNAFEMYDRSIRDDLSFARWQVFSFALLALWRSNELSNGIMFLIGGGFGMETGLGQVKRSTLDFNSSGELAAYASWKDVAFNRFGAMLLASATAQWSVSQRNRLSLGARAQMRLNPLKQNGAGGATVQAALEAAWAFRFY